MKKSGILAPLFSLPSESGIGDMGRQTIEFLDILEENGVGLFQLLPLNPVGFGNSPYQPYSSFAGDEIYINLEKLKEDGLIESRIPPFQGGRDRVYYAKVRSYKEPFLREAFSNFRGGPDFENFRKQKWLYSYALFRALKIKNGGRCWNRWEEDDRNILENGREISDSVRRETEYHIFLQYIFLKQWSSIKDEAHRRGIRLVGDIPFYVGLDSADVFAEKENYLLDKDGSPKFVAGVPPDYFSKTGQRWGNPIYNWDRLKENGYRFWVERIGYSMKLFDTVRIDHFRAFDTYYKIPASCPTAEEGEWVEADGYTVLDTLFREIPDLDIVAEDLGEMRPEVYKMRDRYRLPGMKVIVFSIDTSGEKAEDTFRDRENLIIYTGTHDNKTVTEWYNGHSEEDRAKILLFLEEKGFREGTVSDRFVRYALKSPEDTAIIHIGDILGLGKEGRINTPATVGSPNWEMRIGDLGPVSEALKKFSPLFQGQRIIL